MPITVFLHPRVLDYGTYLAKEFDPPSPIAAFFFNYCTVLDVVFLT